MKKIVFLSLACLTLSVFAEQGCRNDIEKTTPTSRFTINDDNTVTDKKTGLTWMRCSLGQTGKDCRGGEIEEYTWEEAIEEVKDNYRGWRLPNRNELSSIVELSCFDPAINTEVFPNTAADNYYWSSSLYASNGSNAWVVDFDSGDTYDSEKDESSYIRLVRAGQ